MTTLLATFIIALVASLVATPAARRLGFLVGAVDLPERRKVHRGQIPRSGGIALFFSFFLALGICHLFHTNVSEQIVWDARTVSFLLGAIAAFGAGLTDDIHRLNPKIKLLLQIGAASIAFYGGIRIEGHDLLGRGVHYGALSYFVTVCWFLLFINAVNLIDGLDGLASGVVLFASMAMVGLLTFKGDLLTALYFVSLSGILLGFLRYNFNPASIFMGDGGSYFLGYVIAAVSTMSSIKGETSALVLIPLIGMGVPIFDTILSPLRRFLVGSRMFQPDKSHVHHRLLDLGLNTRKAVLVIYAISAVLCIFAIVIANIRDEMTGLFLILLVVCSAIFFRKLRYLEYLTMDKMYGWLRDVTDVTGIARTRRSFLGLQMEIENSRQPDGMWENVCVALDMIKFSKATLDLRQEDHILRFEWAKDGSGCPQRREANGDALMRMHIPLMNGGDSSLGTLTLVKDLRRDPLSSFTIRRVEHLRRAIEAAVHRF